VDPKYYTSHKNKHRFGRSVSSAQIPLLSAVRDHDQETQQVVLGSRDITRTLRCSPECGGLALEVCKTILHEQIIFRGPAKGMGYTGFK
jgi:hypothetical protein